jgi:hypothetical protein
MNIFDPQSLSATPSGCSEEHAMLNIEYVDPKDPEEGILAITINGVKLGSDDGLEWYTPRAAIGETKVAELPEGVEFRICDEVHDNLILDDSYPSLSITRQNQDLVKLTFEEAHPIQAWSSPQSRLTYCGTKKAIIENWKREGYALKLEKYSEYNDWLFIEYSTTVSSESCRSALAAGALIAQAVEDTTHNQLGPDFWKNEEPSEALIPETEETFATNVVIPLLRELGFQNVRYNHGNREFGKDILFHRYTEFCEIEHWAAQTKLGDISGEAGSLIDKIIHQIDDGFKMPFHDSTSRMQQRISKFAVITSGKFTKNAIEKICEKIENHAARNNVVFVDGERLETLAISSKLRGR